MAQTKTKKPLRKQPVQAARVNVNEAPAMTEVEKLFQSIHDTRLDAEQTFYAIKTLFSYLEPNDETMVLSKIMSHVQAKRDEYVDTAMDAFNEMRSLLDLRHKERAVLQELLLKTAKDFNIPA